jgi:hypothetical protein
MKKIVRLLKICTKILSSDEYFLVTAKRDTKYHPTLGPIRYSYDSNTKRGLFYVFVNDYIKNNKHNFKD